MTKHIVETYKEFQPNYAAYKTWGSSEARLGQAVIEHVSEAGELLQLVQKANRKGKDIDREKLLDEMGDSIWGWFGILNEAGFTLEEVLEYNMKKLDARNASR